MLEKEFLSNAKFILVGEDKDKNIYTFVSETIAGFSNDLLLLLDQQSVDEVITALTSIYNAQA